VLAFKIHCREIIKCYCKTPLSAPQSVGGILELIKLATPHSSIFFDIGAYKGLWADAFLNYSADSVKGYLYEPLPEAAEELKKKYNGRNILVTKCALSDNIGKRMFYRHTKCSRVSSLAPIQASNSTTLTVDVTTMDAESKRHNLNYHEKPPHREYLQDIVCIMQVSG
jgi:FkbM family methyltransferase